ncbi:unnamed protein product [Caenorhabditis brenneri]
MSQQRSKPRFEVITLESDDDNDDHDEITVLEARGPNIGRAQARTNRSVPSQVEVIVIDDDGNTLNRVPRKTAKRPRNALGRFCASQNDPPAVIGETSTQSSNATQRKSARMQGQPPVRVALAASFTRSSAAEREHNKANSVEKEAASTSTSSSSQKNTAQSEASTSSMVGSTLQRSMKKEDVGTTPEPAITEKVLRGRVIRSIKTEPLEMDNSREVVEEAQSVKTVPTSSSMLVRNSSAKRNSKLIADPFYMPRAITVPLGVTRVPFHVKISDEQQEIISDYRIRIKDHDNFPVGVELSTRYIRLEEDSEDKDDNTAPPLSTAVLPDFIGPVTKQYTNDAKNDKEEPVWSASKLVVSLRGNEQRLNQCYEKIQNDYLFCVWRQFEGRIPIEVALQHLMKNSFSIEKSLETIEKDCLRRVPQKLKDPSTAQAHQIHRILLNEDLDDYDYRNIQETILKNYHMSEVVKLFHRFTKFYGYADDGWKIVPGCNCSTGVHHDVCRKVDFQPRYACENCTKNFRKTKFQPIGLCLICSTYQKYANKLRPARGVIFDDDDLDKMAEWDRMEIQLKRRVKLSDFNTRYQAKKDSEHRSLQITKEESLTLDFDRLKCSKSRPAELTRQLKPFILPHFSRCYCKDAGWIPVRSKNFYKTTFTEKEIELYRTTILQNPRDIQTAANQLEVEEELVERFIRAYPHTDPIWMGQLEKKLVLKLRECRPFENLPPIIRSFKKDQKKRARTPPIPLE